MISPQLSEEFLINKSIFANFINNEWKEELFDLLYSLNSVKYQSIIFLDNLSLIKNFKIQSYIISIHKIYNLNFILIFKFPSVILELIILLNNLLESIKNVCSYI